MQDETVRSFAQSILTQPALRHCRLLPSRPKRSRCVSRSVACLATGSRICAGGASDSLCRKNAKGENRTGPGCLANRFAGRAGAISRQRRKTGVKISWTWRPSSTASWSSWGRMRAQDYAAGSSAAFASGFCTIALAQSWYVGVQNRARTMAANSSADSSADCSGRSSGRLCDHQHIGTSNAAVVETCKASLAASRGKDVTVGLQRDLAGERKEFSECRSASDWRPI